MNVTNEQPPPHCRIVHPLGGNLRLLEEYVKVMADLTMFEYPNLGFRESVLSFLYEVYNERNIWTQTVLKPLSKPSTVP